MVFLKNLPTAQNQSKTLQLEFPVEVLCLQSANGKYLGRSKKLKEWEPAKNSRTALLNLEGYSSKRHLHLLSEVRANLMCCDSYLKQHVLESYWLQKVMKKLQMAYGLLLVLKTSKHPSLVEYGLQKLLSEESHAADSLAAQLVEKMTLEETDELLTLSGVLMV